MPKVKDLYVQINSGNQKSGNHVNTSSDFFNKMHFKGQMTMHRLIIRVGAGSEPSVPTK